MAISLYIRDPEIDALALRVQAAIDAPTKTEAVRIALVNELERVRTTASLRERIHNLQQAVQALGPDTSDFDMKSFMDEGWKGSCLIRPRSSPSLPPRKMPTH
jgi:antitoxin VapB